MTKSQMYRPERSVIDAVDDAGWMYIEDAMAAAEKALDGAYWDGKDHCRMSWVYWITAKRKVQDTSE